MACGCGLLLLCPMARKTLLVGFVTGSLFIHIIQPLTRVRKETLLTMKPVPPQKAHVHSALLTEITKTLQTVVWEYACIV